jgi:hypothetical protein
MGGKVGCTNKPLVIPGNAHEFASQVDPRSVDLRLKKPIGMVLFLPSPAHAASESDHTFAFDPSHP